MAFQWNACDNETKCEQFSDANYGGGGGSSSSESNSAFSSLYHFPFNPMIHPACRRREKCSLLAFSLGLRTFSTSLVPQGSLPADLLELGVFEWELLPVSDESFEVDFPTDAVVLVTGGLKVCLHWKKDWFAFPRPGFVKVLLDSVLFISFVLISPRLSVINFRDWKKGIFGFVSFFVHPISCFEPCKASSVFSCVIFSNGVCSPLKSVPNVSRYFKCSLFCRISASSFSFSSLTLASDNKNKENSTLIVWTFSTG